jgi:hypothetical protein
MEGCSREGGLEQGGSAGGEGRLVVEGCSPGSGSEEEGCSPGSGSEEEGCSPGSESEEEGCSGEGTCDWTILSQASRAESICFSIFILRLSYHWMA